MTDSLPAQRACARLTRAVPVALALGLGGCLLGPDHQRPSDPEVEALGTLVEDGSALPASHAAAETPAMVVAAEPQLRWWRELGDPQISQLIERAAEHNHDIREARANVLAARALLSEGRFEQAPITDADGRVTRQRTSSGSGATFQPVTSVFGLNLNAAWELDFFGRVRRSVEALAADREQRIAERNLAFVTVAADVARSYIDLRGAQYRLQVAERNAEIQAETYELTQALRDGGRGTDLDVAQALAQLETTRATIPPLQEQVQRAMHRLSVLVGQPPTALHAQLADARPLPALPEVVHVGDPATLLRRRPDVASAEQSLAAATARIGIQMADYFPRLSVVGSGGYLTTEAGDFGTSASERWSFGPSVSWAALDIGRVRARVAAARATADAELAAYEQTVLTALEEAENSIVGYIRARQRQDGLARAEAASREAAHLARERFRAGVEDFLTVLDAELRQLEAQDALANARIDSAQALVAIYRALGGGWQAAFPETRN